MKLPIYRIIIVTDFSTFSESAFKTGLAIAKKQAAEVTILHAADKLNYTDTPRLFQPYYTLDSQTFISVGEYLNMLAAKIHTNTGIKVSSKVLEGTPAEKICAYAQHKNANLVVMGTHGISGVRELFMGSDAIKIINNCSCPTLTVPANWNKISFEKVLFPVQLKPGTFEKYFYARPIIEKNNSEIFVLGLSEKNKPGELKELALLVDKLKLQLYSDGVSFQSALCPSANFPEKVIDAAKEYAADIAVLAVNDTYSSDSSNVSQFTQELLYQLEIPLLSIKPFLHNNPLDYQLEFGDTWVRTKN